MDAFLARQPIFDKKKSLFAYELLFRDSLANYVPKEIDGDAATSRLLSSGLLTMGVDRITGGSRAFINFTQNLLIKGIPLLFHPETTVVEVLEDVEPTPDVIRACKDIAAKGYVLALDDFVFKEDLKPLIDVANIIKFDFRMTSAQEIRYYMQRLPVGRVKLLAEKVETNKEFRQAVAMGFEYFQGYFFCKPEIIQGKEVLPAKLNLMRIMSEMNQPAFDLKSVEAVMTHDVSLTYKFLRYINSAYFSRGGEIQSIRQAILVIGEADLKRFVSLMALSMVAENKPLELVKTSCVRARFCELLGKASGRGNLAGDLYTLGLFSNIDVILDQPMTKILEKLPLRKSIKDALAGDTGELAGILAFSVKFEEGDWDYVKKALADLSVPEAKLPELYAEACEWSNQLESAI